MKVRFTGGAASGSMECPRGESVEACSLAATQKNADILSQLGGKKNCAENHVEIVENRVEKVGNHFENVEKEVLKKKENQKDKKIKLKR